jgi:dihydroflavonol-4-reductase
MKAFVTGGTGFIGRRVVAKLLERGYEVNALVRSRPDAAALQELGSRPVWGDITALESLREGMRGCDLVFHLAAWYKLGAADWRKAETINVDGTRNVLSLAYSLGIPRILYTSTVAVYGDTHGCLPDESYVPPDGPFLTEYDRTKYLAHYKVALPLIKQGAPIIILMPGVVYGPGDSSLVGQMMRYFYQGLFLVLPGPELTLTFAHVDDIAEGHLLAAEKGQPGQSYHLTGDVQNMGEAVRMWAKVTGQRPPFAQVPARFVLPFAPLMGALGERISIPEMLSKDAIVTLPASYIARSDKARQQLGWCTRPLEDGLKETFDWIANTGALAGTTHRLQFPTVPANKRTVAALTLGAAIGVLTGWMILRRRK